jgi:L-amino acid N-acyltransferase YncA
MNTSLIRYRDATLEDAPGISNAHVRSWQESYRGIVPDAHLDSLDPSSRAKMWAERFKDSTFDGHVIVAADSNENIVGFIAVGPSRSQEYPGWGEVRAIYLLRDFKGCGVGRQLFDLGKQRLQTLGYQSFFCWVLKDNPTRYFYESTGGKLSRFEKTIQIGGSNLLEVAYEWQHLKVVE